MVKIKVVNITIMDLFRSFICAARSVLPGRALQVEFFWSRSFLLELPMQTLVGEFLQASEVTDIDTKKIHHKK